MQSPDPPRVVVWVRDGLGALPAGVTLRTRVVPGRPGPTLAAVAWRDGDLLVVGAARGRSGRRRSVGAYCIAHAECPVLVVPPDSFARSVAPRSRLRGLRRRDVWKQFDATKAS
jgi:Universal stress protein family